MNRPKIVVRGVQDLKTHSGTVDSACIPHKAYMRLTCLEMEKYRRQQERQSALQRVKTIDERIKDIDLEESVLLASLKSVSEEHDAANAGSPRRQRTPA